MKILIDIPDKQGELLLSQMRDKKFVAMCNSVSTTMVQCMLARPASPDRAIDTLIATILMSFNLLAINATFTVVSAAPSHKDN